MPRVPESAVTVGVQISPPEARFGDRALANVINQTAQVVGQFGARRIQIEDATAELNAQLEITRALNELSLGVDQSTDPTNLALGVTQAGRDVVTRATDGIQSEQVKSKVGLYGTQQLEALTTSAKKKEFSLGIGMLQASGFEHLNEQRKLAARGNPLQRDLAIQAGIDGIGLQVELGAKTPEEGAREEARFLSSVAEDSIRRQIRDDPEGAKERLLAGGSDLDLDRFEPLLRATQLELDSREREEVRVAKRVDRMAEKAQKTRSDALTKEALEQQEEGTFTEEDFDLIKDELSLSSFRVVLKGMSDESVADDRDSVLQAYEIIGDGSIGFHEKVARLNALYIGNKLSTPTFRSLLSENAEDNEDPRKRAVTDARKTLRNGLAPSEFDEGMGREQAANRHMDATIQLNAFIADQNPSPAEIEQKVREISDAASQIGIPERASTIRPYRHTGRRDLIEIEDLVESSALLLEAIENGTVGESEAAEQKRIISRWKMILDNEPLPKGGAK